MSADLAWLAGLWDGEGSVGVCVSHTARSIHIPVIQINMTHQATLERAADILSTTYGCSIKIHTVQPRDKVRHRVSYHFAVRRTVWLARISEGLIPFATTKLRHWELLKELCDERAARCGRTADGGLFRGGIAHERAPYTAREHAIVLELREVNATANNLSRIRMEANAA